jgi:2-polyprenyl-3-methyl-5-hydroxy-6-metoxy-1,4-benzoquinol methylase
MQTVRRRHGLTTFLSRSGTVRVGMWQNRDMGRLPIFTEHTGHSKLHPIKTSSYRPIGPPPFMRKWLSYIATTPCSRPSGIRILDVGCGRGDVVFWLLDEGWDAWGVDIDARYIDIGRDYLRGTGRDPDRLRVADSNSYPLPSGWFDVVISDQVLEHVANLDELMSEISRVSHRGTLGMHIFPARWRPVEVHMHTPFVHWLPKGAARRRALKGLLSAHIAAAYFSELPIAQRVEIFARFSDEETFYRPLSTIQETMLRYDIKGDPVNASRSKALHHVPWIPRFVHPLAGWIYRNVFSVCIETVQI